jgi:ATP-dependent helicase HrpB
VESWRQRVAWLHAAELTKTGSSDLPDLSATALMGSLTEWLQPHLGGVRSKTQLQKLDWNGIFRGMVRVG